MALDCEDIMTAGTENPLDGSQSGKSECKYSVLGQWHGLSPYMGVDAKKEKDEK